MDDQQIPLFERVVGYWIAKRLVTIAYVSLPNIIAGEYLVPELIQNDANPDNIAQQDP
jgi:lipid-A-disaccharide synthase